MKTNRFLVYALAMASVFTGCKNGNEPQEPSNDDPNVPAPTAITLSQKTLSIEEGQTANLAVLFTPTNASGELVWESTDETIATVSQEGIVTGVKAGNATIVVTCGSLNDQCAVTVSASSVVDTDALLAGSDYYVFAMDETTFGKLKGKVTADFRMNGSYNDDGSVPDGVTSILEIWGRTFEAGTPSGPNAFGLTEGWTCLKAVSGGDWEGNGCGGIRQLQNVDFTKITDEHVLVILYKGPAANNGNTMKFTLYSTVVGGTEVAYSVNANTNGEWQKLEVPVSEIKQKGIDWSQAYIHNQTLKPDGSPHAMYTLGLLIEGPTVVGAELNLDAAFIYKP